MEVAAVENFYFIDKTYDGNLYAPLKKNVNLISILPVIINELVPFSGF